MSWLDNSHWILATLVSLLWLAGFSFLIFKPVKKNASWIPVALLGLFIVGLGVDLFLIHRDLGGAQKLWARGWIGPHDHDGECVGVGVFKALGPGTVRILGVELGVECVERGLVDGGIRKPQGLIDSHQEP